MKRIALMFLLGVLLLSCEKKIGGPVPDVQVDLLYKDQKGLDLLDPIYTDSYKPEYIDVYWLTSKGSKRRVFVANLDLPEMFRVYKGVNGQYVLSVFFNPDVDCFNKDNIATMYISYKDGLEDEFVGKFNKAKGIKKLEKLWINNKLVWESSSQTQRVVTLIK